MTPALPAPVRAAHHATAQARIDVETTSLRVLRDVIGAPPRSKDPVAAADELRQRAAPVYAAARRAARRVSANRMGEELAASGAPVAMPALMPVTGRDIAAAELAASAYADRFLQATTAGNDARAAMRAADKRLASELAAEIGDAFDDERERAEESPRFFPALFKIWDARLDACPVCHRLDGQMRPFGIDFEGDAKPGRVHRYCRCTRVSVFSPLYMGRAA